DSYTRGTFQNFVGLSAGGRRPVRVLMGPWTHGSRTMELSHAGDVEFGHDAALPSFDELHLRWYDRWLRGVDNGLDAEAPLRIFVMGGGSGRRPGGGPPGAGRPLARRARVAAGPHALHRLLLARRRVIEDGVAARGQLRHHLPVRPGPAGALHRRQPLSPALP